MLDYKKQRKLIALSVLVGIVVVVLTIIYIVNLWTPVPEGEKIYQVGKVEYVQKTNEDVLKEYYNDISKMLMNNELDKLVSLVSDDYMKYYNYNAEDLKEYITNKKITNKKLQLSSSSIYNISGYSKVFHLNIKPAGEVYSLDVVVIEKSPNDYRIAFDKFVDVKENAYDKTIESVGLSIKKMTRFLTSVEYKVRITNNYDKAITINSNKEFDALNLVTNGNQGIVKKPITLDFANVNVKIPAKSSREYIAVYNIDTSSDYAAYGVMLLKGVAYEGIVGIKNLEYYINNI